MYHIFWSNDHPNEISQMQEDDSNEISYCSLGNANGIAQITVVIMRSHTLVRLSK